MACVLYERGGFDAPDPDGYAAKNAFMHAIQCGHTSLESGLKKILKIIGERIPDDLDNWHEALIVQVCAPIEGRGRILPEQLFAHADETRKSRSLVVRGYDSFDIGKAAATMEAARLLSEKLPGSLMEFIARIDPPESVDGRVLLDSRGSGPTQ